MPVFLSEVRPFPRLLEEGSAHDELQVSLSCAALTAAACVSCCLSRVRHASFVDGVDLFDNKLFGLSLAETKGQGPRDPGGPRLLTSATNAYAMPAKPVRHGPWATPCAGSHLRRTLQEPTRWSRSLAGKMFSFGGPCQGVACGRTH